MRTVSRVGVGVLALAVVGGAAAVMVDQKAELQDVRQHVEALAEENERLRNQVTSIEDAAADLQQAMAQVVGKGSASARSLSDRIDVLETELVATNKSLFGVPGRAPTWEYDIIGGLRADVERVDQCVSSIQLAMTSTYSRYFYC